VLICRMISGVLFYSFHAFSIEKRPVILSEFSRFSFKLDTFSLSMLSSSAVLYLLSNSVSVMTFFLYS